MADKMQNTNHNLLEKYLSPEMEKYFHKKLRDQDSDYIKLKICELLKFLLLSPNTKGLIPFTSEIDEIWHLWILQTQQYYELVMSMPAQKFLHHSSIDYGVIPENISKEEEEEEINRQFSFIVSYVYNFGSFTEENIVFWPMALRIYLYLDEDLDKFNKYLESFTKEEKIND